MVQYAARELHIAIIKKKNWTVIQGRIAVVAYFLLLEYHQNVTDWSMEKHSDWQKIPFRPSRQ